MPQLVAKRFFEGLQSGETIPWHQWIGPLAQLPLEMVGDERGVGFWRNRLTWFGFAIPCVVFSINGLHGWFPSIPMITLDISRGQYFVNPPWNCVGFFVMYISFAAIGFFFLLPAEIIFSLWFFHLFAILQSVIANSCHTGPPCSGCSSV